MSERWNDFGEFKIQRDLYSAFIIKNVIGYNGKIKNDLSKPDGTPRKLLDVSLLHKTGWKHKVDLEEGIRKVYKWYLEQNNQ